MFYFQTLKLNQLNMLEFGNEIYQFKFTNYETKANTQIRYWKRITYTSLDMRMEYIYLTLFSNLQLKQINKLRLGISIHLIVTPKL